MGGGAFETIFQYFIETALIGTLGFVIYEMIEKYFSGRTFKNAVDSIEKATALGVDTVVNLYTLETAVRVAGGEKEKIRETIKEVKEFKETVTAS